MALELKRARIMSMKDNTHMGSEVKELFPGQTSLESISIKDYSMLTTTFTAKVPSF